MNAEERMGQSPGDSQVAHNRDTTKDDIAIEFDWFFDVELPQQEGTP